MPIFFDVVITGIGAGVLYGLVALAFVLVLKTTNVVNFFQGDTCAFGAYFTIIFVAKVNFSLPLAVVAAILCALALTVLLELVGLRPMYKISIIQVVIGTVAVSMIMRYLIRLYWGPQVVPFPDMFKDIPLKIPGIPLGSATLWMMILAAVSVSGFAIFFQYTRWGMALRACCQDRLSASLMGINVGVMMSLAWGLSGAIGSIAGIAGAHMMSVYPEMGIIGLKGFVASILGGANSIPGALLGGIVLGVLENLGGFYISFAFRDLIAFVIMIFMLLVRPNGLLGKQMVRKV
jgi:branched-chain amino acid transport system permease protein